MLQKYAIWFREKYATSFSHIFFWQSNFEGIFLGSPFVGLDFFSQTEASLVRDRARDFLTKKKGLGCLRKEVRINGDRSNRLFHPNTPHL